ncbi:peptidase [Paenibacillus baekrokdamisoli]|uniref:Peptidase n=1 Tax=Paenibacillus baekrokdamisoli TaxID=1712516 RepID=A0A3G9IJI4_9BACL|nr:slipin family protein [Paenibacillus baekrokdamisoli]MBB3067748.1 regulator of protease activity HflC (stomatin/prohibitin superfamily) [Paenibacillus baekrokdamisoli]BBH19070.1 peptidase [Paenibacillus baekrokdamisoli]
MFNKVIIQTDQRGLQFTKGSYKQYLKPGTYRFSPFSDSKVEVLDISKPFAVAGKDLQLFLQDEQLLEDLHIIDVADGELALRYEEGKFLGVLTAGKYAYWKVYKNYRFVHVNLRIPALSSDIDAAIVSKLSGFVHTFEVAEHQIGLLYYNHTLQRELTPGAYVFWKGPAAVAVKTLDMRQQQLDMTGQEIMTEDKVPLRLNFVCQYKIIDPLKTLQIRSFEDQLYILLQLILREYVGTLKLDDLLRMKQEIAGFVLSRLQEKQADYGVEFLSSGLKDIILPGDVKDILNMVLLAEKKAQANLITRREETASTRSLLNTAKLMDENQTLFRLKELEFLEKICEKIGTISLTGGGGLLEQLNALMKAKADQA